MRVERIPLRDAVGLAEVPRRRGDSERSIYRTTKDTKYTKGINFFLNGRLGETSLPKTGTLRGRIPLRDAVASLAEVPRRPR